jgi:hypothetical protein
MNNNKNYKCDYCNNYFSSRQSKCNHIKLKHHNEHNHFLDNIIKCKNCNKTFTLKSSLDRHIKSRCQIIKKQTDKSQMIKKETDKSQIINSNNINSNNTNSNNITTINNITINSYKNPNTSDFSLLEICNIFDEQFNIVLKLIETTYFNEKLEENHSFYVSNMNGNYLQIFNNQIELKKYVFDDIFTIVLNTVKTLFKKYKNKLFEVPKQIEIKEKIKALEDIHNEKSHTYKSYIKLINVLAYNKKEMVIDVWNKLKKIEQEDPNKDNEIINWADLSDIAI